MFWLHLRPFILCPTVNSIILTILLLNLILGKLLTGRIENLETVVIVMRFSLSIVHLIMKCVYSVRFSILINGVHSHVFTLIGVVAGGSLSSYLFIICAEGLSEMIRYTERQKPFCRSAF